MNEEETNKSEEPELLVEEVEEVISDETSEQVITDLTDKTVSKELYYNEDFEKQLAFLDILVKGKYLPEYIKTKETAFSVYQMGKELGLQPMASFNNIIPINYKLTLSVKLQAAILQNNGVWVECIVDNGYLYNINGEKKITDAPIYPINSEDHNKYYVTKVTKMRGERMMPFNGEMRKKVVEVEFTLKEAEIAGLTKKDNWKNHQPDMQYARCQGRLANRIAPDLMLGMKNNIEIQDSEK